MFGFIAEKIIIFFSFQEEKQVLQNKNNQKHNVKVTINDLRGHI